jgi:hypothetical protein
MKRIGYWFHGVCPAIIIVVTFAVVSPLLRLGSVLGDVSLR